MGFGLLRRALALLAAAWLLACGMPASAEPFAPGSVCHAFLQPGETIERIAHQSNRWNCSKTGWGIETDRAVLRFDLRGAAPGAMPRYFITRSSRFDRMTLQTDGPDGRGPAMIIDASAMRMAQGVYEMYVALPALPPNATAITVEIDRPHYGGIVSEARLERSEPVGQASALDTLVAILCGLLIGPMLLDLASYRVLRERFLLWHALTGAMMLTYSAVTGGVLNRFVQMSQGATHTLTQWSFSAAIASAVLFYEAFVEPEALDPWHRRILRWIAAYCIGLALFEQLAPLPVSVMQPFYYLAWLPVIALMVWLIGVAVRRNSRAAKFQVAAWTPLILVSFYRILGNIGITDTAVVAFEAFYVSIALEVIITGMGVADRFMIIKRERDRARTEARMLAQLADRDPLTGMLNRRAVEGRFGELLAEGFATVALIDIDHFKTINDSRGHAIGDAVLRAVAQVLAPDGDTLAVRLGGEEFMLLLRGKDGAERAERLRTAIPPRVAAEVPGLENLVTASMGLVEFPPGGRLRCDFTSLYAQCDRLLYEAKNTGRNRMLSERMQSFGGRAVSAAA